MSTQTHRLTGLDAQNPLAYFAALGLLRVLDDRAKADGLAPPRLWFENDGREIAHVDGPWSLDDIIAAVVEDARGVHGAAALALAYDKEGARVPTDHPEAIRELKPVPAVARDYLDEVSRMDRRSADLAAAFFSELVQDNNGNTKPTALHFAAGQQRWLDMVRGLRAGVTAEHVRTALVGPWEEDFNLPSLAWDSTVARNYALRATDPSTDKRGTVPGAHWLAVAGLCFFPVFVRGTRLITARVVGGWKDSVLTWPVWGAPATAAVAMSLLRSDVRSWNAAQRAAVGVTGCFESAILRSDQGGYGSFTPAGPSSARG